MFKRMCDVIENGHTVSTVWRDSSAVHFPGKYYETMVFDNNDLIDGKYPRIVDQAETGVEKIAIKNHSDMVVKYASKEQWL